MRMTQVCIGIGSNINKVKNINGSLSSLRNYFGKINVSPIYQSKAVGMDGDDFYNLVVQFETNMGIEILESRLREIEYNFGRKRNQAPHTSRTLDIDLLLFGNLVSEKHNIPRDDITNYSFVLKPLCDVEPDLIHPIMGKTMRVLWGKFDSSKQPIIPLENNILENV